MKHIAGEKLEHALALPQNKIKYTSGAGKMVQWVNCFQAPNTHLKSQTQPTNLPSQSVSTGFIERPCLKVDGD